MLIGHLPIVVLVVETLPNYSVSQLNAAIGLLLARGFAPRFLLNATVSKSQLKKGHLWLTLTDGESSISCVVWSSQLKKFTFRPNETDGVVVIGKLNFWEARASLVVQALELRPSISTVLRKFENTRDLLFKEGLIAEDRRRPFPKYPTKIAILTSSPSSALADMLRTAKDRWPLTKLVLIPIPVQGYVEKELQACLKQLASLSKQLGIQALVIARGGGNREDLMLFDDELLCREIASFPLPVVTGIGHEDDLTVADLVADHRSATPTAAIVHLLPSLEMEQNECLHRENRLNDHFAWRLCKERQALLERRHSWNDQAPLNLVKRKREQLIQRMELLKALSPDRWFSRGFSVVCDELGVAIRSIRDVSVNDKLVIQLSDGEIHTNVETIQKKRKSS